jgi:CheY-like chemotaxis protein
VAAATDRRFDAIKVLLVEDETLVSFLLEDMLHELGCAAVWHAGGVNDALAILRTQKPDVAILDVNLGRELVYPLADHLDRIGIPYVFATGYGSAGLPAPWNRHPVLQKPFPRDTLASVMWSALRR